MNENKFEALTNEGDVILVQEEEMRGYLGNCSMFKLSDIVRKVSCQFLNLKEEFWWKEDIPRRKWVIDGIKCEILKVGEGIWKKGKMRIKVVLEFCPDEPKSSNSLLTASNSPLDDLRG